MEEVRKILNTAKIMLLVISIIHICFDSIIIEAMTLLLIVILSMFIGAFSMDVSIDDDNSPEIDYDEKTKEEI